jgi:DNA/RNA-binding domain of Phe-tRNA-synthetase-like protein
MQTRSTAAFGGNAVDEHIVYHLSSRLVQCKSFQKDGGCVTYFIVEPQFWSLFPDAEIAVAVIRGLNNSAILPEATRTAVEEMLSDANLVARSHLTAPTLTENREVAVWREAFTRFKTKKGARSSIEALLKRVDKGNPVGSINPLVDIYNSISLRHALPCGGEDLDTFVGDLRLTVTGGGDHFLALGDSETDPTLPGEVAYLDDVGAVCRCWNWRDGQRTMLTEVTTNAFLIIESVDPSRGADVRLALDELTATVVRLLGGEVVVKQVLHREQQSCTLMA